MVSILPWIAFGIIPVTVVYWFLLLHYRQTGNDLQRLDAVSRSPVQAMLSEALDGASSIRVFLQRRKFMEKFFNVVDRNSAALLCFVTAQRWLAFRIELLGSFIVLLSSLLIISMNDTLGIDAGLAGLLVGCKIRQPFLIIALLILCSFCSYVLLSDFVVFELYHHIGFSC